mmetsp:Transcript_48899/g.95589  ORF Transcript_48899/g.95589 Transcript_48899/m.95589 type:complete len:465 (+) Transcript_48899:324-1718(+)|eukprot:CAMPEP_0194306030 /NCGR_PEP_ID=MMETSP0171-20130528/3308_1 /TAXON_ID=218684 /ORGANISM="Corethron pennatum, Strain L29A3" /LENGTH=464 /DNA_ID=CAMNT_0039057713 /DNA_START=305 /DNA_END=1699 /DNA_ORIENTATION=+
MKRMFRAAISGSSPRRNPPPSGSASGHLLPPGPPPPSPALPLPYATTDASAPSGSTLPEPYAPTPRSVGPRPPLAPAGGRRLGGPPAQVAHDRPPPGADGDDDASGPIHTPRYHSGFPSGRTAAGSGGAGDRDDADRPAGSDGGTPVSESSGNVRRRAPYSHQPPGSTPGSAAFSGYYDDEGADVEAISLGAGGVSISFSVDEDEMGGGGARRRGLGERSGGGASAFPPPADPRDGDIAYEERYGDSYVGASLKYLYPQGYTGMRPRGGPWKLSLVIFALFCWLSVFIVGHCAQRVQNDQTGNGGDDYAGDDDASNKRSYDDDEYMIETHWCGSKMLYTMWVLSGVVTGLSGAYCAIIGYIKVRDFAVANGRSQPPKVDGKSDYYVRVRGGGMGSGSNGGGHPPNTDEGGRRVDPSEVSSVLPTYQKNGGRHYRTSIYQSDGTPQFWGEFIYHPNQAAVAVTSR